MEIRQRQTSRMTALSVIWPILEGMLPDVMGATHQLAEPVISESRLLGDRGLQTTSRQRVEERRAKCEQLDIPRTLQPYLRNDVHEMEFQRREERR